MKIGDICAPDITLSTGRVVRHTLMANGATDASIVGDNPVLTPAEWDEYALVIPLHAEIDRLKQKMAAARSLLLPLGGHVTPSVLVIREAIRILR